MALASMWLDLAYLTLPQPLLRFPTCLRGTSTYVEVSLDNLAHQVLVSSGLEPERLSLRLKHNASGPEVVNLHRSEYAVGAENMLASQFESQARTVHAMRLSVSAKMTRPHPNPLCRLLRFFVASGTGYQHTALLQCLGSQVMVATRLGQRLSAHG